LIALESVHVGFPNRVLLEDASLRVMAGDRLALIGENGSGKSTLLRILAGEVSPTAGRVERRKGLVVGYLPQSGLSHRGRVLWEEVVSALPEWLESLERRKRLLDRIASLKPEDPEHAKCMVEYGDLETAFEQSGGYARESRLKRILDGLGFRGKDYERPVEEFSAGWQMRIGLAKVLAREPDLMLLDEPTDHLDLDAKNWLEEYLTGVSTCYILVSHDRHLLDALVNRVAEIYNAKLEIYTGNYTKYIKEKTERTERLEAEYEAQQERLRRMESFVARNRVRKDRARQAQSRLRQMEKIERIAPARREQKMHFPIRVPPRAPRNLVELHGVTKCFPGTVLFQEVTLNVERGEHIAVVGPNGAGKSTLLRILEGSERVDTGLRVVGDGVSIGYYAQDEGAWRKAGQSVLEEILSCSPRLTQGEARSLLARFRFRGDEVFKPVEALSGGERARLAMARIFPKRHHLLLLDEPTNHLDILSRQALLEALKAYGGTLVFVSHDRYFIQEIATRVLEVRDERIRSFPGTYEAFLAAREQGRLVPLSADRAGDSAKSQEESREEEKRERVREREQKKAEQRRRQRRWREIERIEGEISGLERALRQVEGEMENPDLARDHLALERLHAQATRIREDLKELYDAWEGLHEEASAERAEG
jgi:ATP-binding cassette subfamily F protein 3